MSGLLPTVETEAAVFLRSVERLRAGSGGDFVSLDVDVALPSHAKGLVIFRFGAAGTVAAAGSVGGLEGGGPHGTVGREAEKP